MKQILKELLYGKSSQQVTQQQQNEVMVMEEPQPITRKPRKQYPKEVEAIHLAFNTEADKLLAEAQSILQKTTLDEVVKNKATLAQQLGFTRVKEVQAKHEYDATVSESKQIMEAVQEASKYITTNKWIPLSSVERICKQWGLLFGTPSMYKGFLPNVNLLEIQDFKNKYYDKLHYVQVYEMYFESASPLYFFNSQEEKEQYEENTRRGSTYDKYYGYSNSFSPNHNILYLNLTTTKLNIIIECI